MSLVCHAGSRAIRERPCRCLPADGGTKSPSRTVERDGEPCARISHVGALPPFPMSIVSCDDLWIFADSYGPFTAGRVHPDGVLFPCQTADKILRHPDSSGAP